MRAHCKDCGFLLEIDAHGAAYCPLCKAKRFRQPVEMDPKTGKWEGT